MNKLLVTAFTAAALLPTLVAARDHADVAKAWSAGRTVDAQSRFLIPGLCDMHVHFGGGQELVDENKALLPLYVAYGVTAVRDASGDLADEVLSWRRAIAGGSLLGPTLFSSGPKIEGTKPIWKGTIETGSEAEVDAAIARLRTLAVDFVKITDNTLKPELFLYAVRRARAAGLKASGHIPMAITVRQAIDGTDAGFLNSFNYPGIGLHDELALFVERGLTPAQALSSATRTGPAWFGLLDRHGSVETGKAADLVLLDRNPLEDIRATRSIHTVMLRGTVHDRPALDRMLADTRAKVGRWQ